MNAAPQDTGEDPIRISFVWIVLGLLLVLGVGVVGGLIGQELFGPDLPALTNEDGEQLVTTIQQVTVSPNQASAQVVRTAERSVMALGRVTGEALSMDGVGLVVTSDGLVVSTLDVPRSDVVAFDDSGRSLPIDFVGDDEVYGLRYFRLRDGVFVPLDLLGEDIPVASELIALSRHEITFESSIHRFGVNEYDLPSNQAPGVQKVLNSSDELEDAFVGSPILNDGSQVAGVIIQPQTGTAISSTTLRLSIDRVISRRIEYDPFDELGFNVSYDFGVRESEHIFAPIVTGPTSGKPAAIAGLRSGDIIVRIGGQDVSWDTAIAEQLSDELPLEIVVLRDDEEHTVTLRSEE